MILGKRGVCRAQGTHSKVTSSHEKWTQIAILDRLHKLHDGPNGILATLKSDDGV